jgi:hypothetical protein
MLALTDIKKTMKDTGVTCEKMAGHGLIKYSGYYSIGQDYFTLVRHQMVMIVGLPKEVGDGRRLFASSLNRRVGS